METFSALLAICAGNSPVSGEFPAQRPVTRSFDVFFDVRVWVNTREAGDLRRYHIHYDVIVMFANGSICRIWHFQIFYTRLNLFLYHKCDNHSFKIPVFNVCRRRLITLWDVVCQIWANIYQILLETLCNINFICSCLSIDCKSWTWTRFNVLFVYNLLNLL